MNVLIVKLSSLGDVVQTLPVVADIHAAVPNAHIDWVVEEAFEPLVSRLLGERGLARVIPCGLRRWRKAGLKGWFSPAIRTERAAFQARLQSKTYDVVIDCQGLIKSALVALTAKLAPGGRRGSFANPSDACGYEWPVRLLLPHNQIMPKRIHAIARTRLLVAKMLGYQQETRVWQSPPVVAFNDLPEHIYSGAAKRVMFTHGTTRADNEWAFDNWLQLGLQLLADRCEIFLPQASEAEQTFCIRLQETLLASVPAALRASAKVTVLPRLNLSLLLSGMATCDGVIGVDSGLSHMAVALNLPHVQIFSQDRAWRAGPLAVGEGGVPHQVAIGGTFSPTVSQVWAAWQRVQC
jgi:heptosyltransferase-1